MRDQPEVVDLLYRVVGRDIVAVTEARYWFDGRRGGDEESLVHFWLHFQDNPPLMAHACGDDLLLGFGEPYTSYGMAQHGETRVGPAAAPDLLADLPGRRLRDAALMYGSMAVSSVSGVRLHFDHDDLFIASSCDEWVIRRDEVPPDVEPYLTSGDWLLRPTSGPS